MQLPWCLAPLQLKQAVLEGPLKEQGGAAAYLIKQQHTWPGQDCPGNGDPLLLPAGQPDASLAYSGVVALRKTAGSQQRSRGIQKLLRPL